MSRCKKATHKTPTRHGRNTTLPPEPAGYRTNLRAKWRNCATVPARPYAAFIVKIPGRRCNLKRYGAESRNLILSAICGQVAKPFHADVFIAHFGPAGVTAAKLRELGVIRGKIATIFHGIDISRRGSAATTTLPNINNCFAVATQVTDKRSVGRKAAKNGLPEGKNRRIAYGRGHDAL